MAFRVGYVHDLYLHGIESALREHVRYSLYPEWAATADDMLGVRKSIVLCACGLPERSIGLAGEVHQAAYVVTLLDLEEFVDARIKARLN